MLVSSMTSTNLYRATQASDTSTFSSTIAARLASGVANISTKKDDAAGLNIAEQGTRVTISAAGRDMLQRDYIDSEPVLKLIQVDSRGNRLPEWDQGGGLSQFSLDFMKKG